MRLARDLVALVQRGVRLRVRIFAGLEIAVRLFLRGNDGDVHADAAEHGADRLVARAAQRRVEQIQVIGRDRGKALAENGLIVALPQLRRDEFHAAFRKEVLKALFRREEIRDFLDLGKHAGRRLVRHLAAVRAVALDAVIDARVVAGGNDDAAAAAKLAHGKREHRRRGQLMIDIDMHAALREGYGAQLRIAAGVVAGVIADGAALRQLRRGQPCGKALRRAANGEVVQAIRADAHNAADARGTELQLRAEAALALRLVVLHGGQRSAPASFSGACSHHC